MPLQRLSDLREPPVAGRFYLVPFVRFTYLGHLDRWPVIGPMHTDLRHFNFPEPHYHVDARFLTARQVARVKAFARFTTFDGLSEDKTLAGIVGGHPLAKRRREEVALPKHRPSLMRRKCRSAVALHVHGARNPVKALRADYTDPAMPITKADGRQLCPHRKVDLSSFPPDEHGIVTCPLHGLRVRCA
jgi:hypothetical protein